MKQQFLFGRLLKNPCPDLATATKVSDRMVTFLLTTAVATFDRDVTKFIINRSSIKRQRTKLRAEIVETLRDSSKSSTPLTVHLDGKLLLGCPI